MLACNTFAMSLWRRKHTLLRPSTNRSGRSCRTWQRLRCDWRKRSGSDLDPQDLEAAYFLCALQKALKVVGRFYFLDIEKHKPGYLRYIPSTVRQILRILPRFPELAEMTPILLRYLTAV